MAVTLTYDNTIARVRVNCTVLGDLSDAALVERTVDNVRWTTVRGGRAWPTTAGTFNAQLDDYEFESGSLTTYRIKSLDTVNFPSDSQVLSGVVLDGTSGCNITTPDAATLDIVGDIDIRAEFTPRSWSVAGAFCSKWSGAGQRGWVLRIDAARTLTLFWSNDGTAQLSKVSTTTVPIPASGRIAVRATLDVDNGAAGHTVTFYTATTIDSTWVQLGSSVITAGVTSIFSNTSAAEIGTNDGGTSNRFAGVIHRVEVRAGIGGTVQANPNFEAQANAAASFADTATVPKTWTMNGASEIVVAQSDTITATIDSVWLKSIIRPYLNTAVRVVGFSEVTRPASNGLFDVIGRSFPVAVTDVRGSRRYTLTVRTTTREDAEDFDLFLASGDPVFLHVPTDTEHLWLPSVYAVIGDSTMARLGIKSDTQADFTLPLTEVAAPAADVVGLAIVWQSVLNGFATWQDVIDTFTDWQDVLDHVGAAADVIVL